MKINFLELNYFSYSIAIQYTYIRRKRVSNRKGKAEKGITYKYIGDRYKLDKGGGIEAQVQYIGDWGGPTVRLLEPT